MMKIRYLFNLIRISFNVMGWQYRIFIGIFLLECLDFIIFEYTNFF